MVNDGNSKPTPSACSAGPSGQRGKRQMSLNTRLTMLVGVLLLAIIGIIGSTLWVTNTQKADGLVINLAGRQRMLTQMFAKEILQEANNRQEADIVIAARDQNAPRWSAKTRKLFEQTLAALQHGGKTFTDLSMMQPVILPATSTPRITEQLVEVETLWKSVAEAALVIESEPVGTQAYVASLQALPVHANDCLKEMDLACGMYQEDSESRVRMVTTIQHGAGMISLLTFIGLVMYIRLKVSRPLKDALSLAKAIEQATDVVVITDTEATIQYTNPTFERVTGYTCEEAVGQNVRILKSGKHDDAFFKEMWETLGRGETWRGEFINKKKDGTLYTEEASISPVQDAAGNTVNYVAVKRDITERRRAEQALREAQEDLLNRRRDEKELVEAELAKTRNELVKSTRLATLGQLTATVSHEIRNPLGVIRTAFYSVAEQVRGRTPLVDRALARAERSIVRCDRIIEDLLDYTRTKESKPRPTEIDRWLGGVLDEQDVPEHITVTRKLAAGVHLAVDQEQLRRCVVNLVTNACQAMAETQLDDARLTVQTTAEDDRLLVSVGDTGCGIDREGMVRVFEPLYTTKGFGIGLGLPLVEQLMRQLGGDITIQSEPGKGTTATLRLPVPPGKEP